jgi:hypothetical protein
LPAILHRPRQFIPLFGKAAIKPRYTAVVIENLPLLEHAFSTCDAVSFLATSKDQQRKLPWVDVIKYLYVFA